MSGPSVALVLVSHSRQLAEGARELAAQMAPGVQIVAAGGMDDGGIGTSYDAVEAAISRTTAEGGSAVVLTDLGSAVLTTESVLDLAEPEVVERVRLADAPFVEGAVAAAVAAHGGAGLEAVLAAAEQAGATFRGTATAAPAGPAAAAGAGSPAASVTAAGPGGGADGVQRATVTLRNRLGLHARPAAVVARMLAGYDAQVRVNGVNGASVLELMKLGATGGQELTIEAEGPQAAQARDALVAAVEEGFGEV